jgi:hypothetical protein
MEGEYVKQSFNPKWFLTGLAKPKGRVRALNINRHPNGFSW